MAKEERQPGTPGGGRVQVNSQGDKRCYACGHYGHLSYNYSCPNKHSPDTPGQSHKALLGKHVRMLPGMQRARSTFKMVQ